MSEQNDTSRLDRLEARMEDQERRLERDQPPRSLSGGGGRGTPTERARPGALDLDRKADQMEDQERRLENDLPPPSIDPDA